MRYLCVDVIWLKKRFQGGRKLSFGCRCLRQGRRVRLDVCLAMEVELYGELPTASGKWQGGCGIVSHALSANSWVGEYDGLHTFSTLSVISGKVARDSRKLKPCLKSVDGFYAGKSGF
ncbi:hypothetical protein EV2_013318 [Malus domestica]